MAFNYDKIRNRDKTSEQMWSSYSDLFMVLSLIFLLLYVVSSIRTGTNTIQKAMESQRLQAKVEEMNEQMRVYNTVKDNYLDTQATNEEQQSYQELMERLTLLQDEAREEKRDLRAKAAENEAKERALNKYQQMIRNIIDANTLAKAGLKARDEVLEVKRQTIKQNRETIAAVESELENRQQELLKKSEIIAQNEVELEQRQEQIETLNADVETKRQEIEANREEIEQVSEELDQQIKDLREARKQRKISKAKLEKQIKNLRSKSQKQIEKLEAKNTEVTMALASTTDQLEDATQQLESTSEALARKRAEAARLDQEMKDATAQYKAEMEEMKDQFDQEMATKRAAFEDSLKKEKLSSKQRAAKEKKFRESLAKEKKDLEQKLGGLQDKIAESEKELAEAQAKQKEYQQYVASLQKEKGQLEQDLKASENIINNKRKIAKQINDNFRKAGISADVDGKTGDVVITFGDEYFDTGRARLKPNMEKQLRKFMPIYAKSLFEDADIAEKIDNVEIVGFASPTYRGRYIDPQSLELSDRDAVDYNLDLSYKRARSIFKYITDTRQMKYRNQKRLLPLMKVTGRSFLAEEVKGLDLESGMSKEEYCKQFNCKKAQKVIIKFNLKD